MNEFQIEFLNKYMAKVESNEEVKGLIKEVISAEIDVRKAVGNSYYINKITEEVREVLNLINNYIDEYRKILNLENK